MNASYCVALLALFLTNLRVPASNPLPCDCQSISSAQYETLRKLLLKDTGRLSQRWCCYDVQNITTGCTDASLVKLHVGVDFGAAADTRVYASAPGQVINLVPGDDCPSTKNCLSTLAVYNDTLNVTFLYLHMRDFYVNKFEHVDTGSLIGGVGSRGATLNHLHYEVRPDSRELASTCISGTINPFTNTPAAQLAAPENLRIIKQWGSMR